MAAKEKPMTKAEIAKTVARGRSAKKAPKAMTMLRIDTDVVAHFKATGPDWQTKINEVLRRAAKRLK